ncbi:MAG: ABC transporter permease, partial [Bacteroidetes bacterium]
LGKFLASFLIVAVALACTLPFYISVSMLGNVDHGAILMGYLGLLLLSAAYISIGLFASSLTNNQIVAFMLALFIGIFFHFLFDMMAAGTTGWLANLLQTLSVSAHFDSIARGVVDSKDVVFFLSLVVLGLLLAEYNLIKKR